MTRFREGKRAVPSGKEKAPLCRSCSTEEAILSCMLSLAVAEADRRRGPEYFFTKDRPVASTFEPLPALTCRTWAVNNPLTLCKYHKLSQQQFHCHSVAVISESF